MNRRSMLGWVGAWVVLAASGTMGWTQTEAEVKALKDMLLYLQDLKLNSDKSKEAENKAAEIKARRDHGSTEPPGSSQKVVPPKGPQPTENKRVFLQDLTQKESSSQGSSYRVYLKDLTQKEPSPQVSNFGVYLKDLTQKEPSPQVSNFGVDLNLPFNFVKEPADPLFGATLSPVEDAVRAHLQIPPGRGLAVGLVEEGGPCAQVGVRPHDILLSLGEKPIAKVADLAEGLKALGDKQGELKVMRAGKTISLVVRPVYRVTMGIPQKEETEYFIGVSIETINDLLKSQLNLDSDKYIVINEVIKDSPAEKTGLQKFDVITQVEGKPVEGTDPFRETIQKAKNTPLKLQVLRGGKPTTIEITPAVRKKEVGKNEPIQKDNIRTWTLDYQANMDELYRRIPRTELHNPSMLLEMQQREKETRAEMEKLKSALRALEEKQSQPKPK